MKDTDAIAESLTVPILSCPRMYFIHGTKRNAAVNENSCRRPQLPQGKMTRMSTAAEAIRKLLLAHFKGDEEAFRAAAREFVERERGLGVKQRETKVAGT